MKDKKHDYRNYHRIIKCWAIEVLEGKGTQESTAHIEYYIIDEEGKKIGTICTLQQS